MTKIDIFSGFLGAGKTTLIKKLIKEAYQNEQVVLIENEFGEIGIDGGFLKDAGIKINELNSGCICCSLVGDFGKALKKVLEEYHPDRVLVEPSGVGKLSDVIRAVETVQSDDFVLNGFCTVVDANKCKMYMKNFGEFFNDQIEHANTIILSHTAGLSEERIAKVVEMIREKNADATLVTTDWDALDGALILKSIEQKNTIQKALDLLKAETEEMDEEHEHHHHHHDDDDDDCCCHDEDHEHHHHHDDDDDECCHDEEHGHHHHHHDDDDDDDEECSCGCGEHHHHHHHADDVFTSWGVETTHRYTTEEMEGILENLLKAEYGTILRAKGIVPATDGTWIHFDYVPGEPDVRLGPADITGRLCVIGSNIDEQKLAELFKV